MRTKVRAIVTYAYEVTLEVERNGDRDPCDLTDEERDEALALSEDELTREWLETDISRVEVVEP